MPNLNSNESKTATTNVENSTTSKTNEEGGNKVLSIETRVDEQKEYSVKEIFAMMNKKSKELTLWQEEITAMEKQIMSKKSEIAELRKTIKPISRVTRRFNPNESMLERVTTTERRTIKNNIAVLKNQIILLEEELLVKKASHAKYSKDVAQQLKMDRLKQRARSQRWTRQNRHSIEARLLKTLNNLRLQEPSIMRELAKEAVSKSKDSNKNFENLLKRTLDDFDIEISILCSHELKPNLYRVIRETLKSWNSRSNSEIKELALK